MKIGYIAAECYPFIKSGGLGDVAYAFPRALKKEGVDVFVVLPYKNAIKSIYKKEMVKHLEFSIVMNGVSQPVTIKKLNYKGIDYFFVGGAFDGDDKLLSYYREHDDASEYSFFSLAVVKFLSLHQGKIDVLHLNDWHTGTIPLLIKVYGDESLKSIKTVFTIHNLQYQGAFGKEHVLRLLGLNASNKILKNIVQYDVFSFMRAGIETSDIVTTVSPTYMLEIQRSELGMGLNDLLLTHSGKLNGILNGLDTEVFDPENDDALEFKYGPHNWVEGKKENKKHLQNKYKLEVNDKKLLIGIVSRLVNQKGFDIFDIALDKINSDLNVQFIVLGTGDRNYENNLNYASNSNPKNFKFLNTYDENIAREIYAGVDAFLVPSYFEPSGLTQLISLKYGTVPIVRRTGGLADTIIDDHQDNGTGFFFDEFNAGALYGALENAKYTFETNQDKWHRLVENGLKSKFEWSVIAKKYIDLYR